jgi:sec-independent protein translocase protein TatA
MNSCVFLFLESLGGGELLVILLFVLLFFGSKNIPNLARGLGRGIREFKDAMNGVQSEIRQGMYEVEKQGRMEEPEKPVATSEKASEETPAPLPEIKPEERSASR